MWNRHGCDNGDLHVGGVAAYRDTRRGAATRRLRPLHGFTLIELLVVVAIISLLVSILLPSLNRAKDLAKATVCKSNLHQLQLATEYYRDDYKVYPLSWYWDGATKYIWDILLAPYYGNNAEVDHCPSDADQPPNALSYAMNQSSFPANQATMDIRQPVVLYIDATRSEMIFVTPHSANRWHDYLGWGMPGYALRHDGKYNVVFTDGSIEASDNLEPTWNGGLRWVQD